MHDLTRSLNYIAKQPAWHAGYSPNFYQQMTSNELDSVVSGVSSAGSGYHRDGGGGGGRRAGGGGG